MDTSEQNIKMCEKAVEIQALKPTKFDWLGNCYFGTTHFHSENEPSLFGTVGFKLANVDAVWLPRQDQLQEMVVKLGGTLESLLTDFIDFCQLMSDDGTYVTYVYCCASMEQLWLAFVMKEKYNKVWNGEDWCVVIPETTTTMKE